MADQNKKMVTFIIERQDSPTSAPYTEEFEVAYRPALNVVAALMEIQKNPVTKSGKKTTAVVWECNCLEKVCGACMMVINGKARQACAALIDQLEQPIRLAPARTFPVIRDLAIDRAVMFESLKRVQGWVKVDGSWEVKDAPIQNPYTAQTAYEISHCMTCGCCLEACPNVGPQSDFILPCADGPGISVQPSSARKIRQGKTLECPDGKRRHHKLRQQPKLCRSLPETDQIDDLLGTA